MARLFYLVNEPAMLYNFFMNNPHYDRSKLYTVIGGIVFAIILIVIGMVLILWAGKNREIPVVTPIVQVTRIPAPTSTPLLVIPTIQTTETAATETILPPGVIGKGVYVQVTGTDGTGLRMRSEPGTSSDVRFVAMDSEVFLVIDGPNEKDGYTWWQLEAPYDKTRTGWSADAFLSLIESESSTPSN